jgi:hypothetical protein
MEGFLILMFVVPFFLGSYVWYKFGQNSEDGSPRQNGAAIGTLWADVAGVLIVALLIGWVHQ